LEQKGYYGSSMEKKPNREQTQRNYHDPM
jgi:hypothetical protein